MKQVSFIIPHFCTWKWTAICVWHLKKYGIPVDQQIIVVDNSPGHPSIKAITETSLGDGVKFVSGEPDFSSHGRAYDLGYGYADGDWIFTCESDSYPTQCGWFNEYVKASPDHDLIGPEIPQSSGRYIHPAGALIRREWVERAQAWQQVDDIKKWVFCPGAALELGTSDRAYHVVAHKDWLAERQVLPSLQAEIDVWKRAGVWQEMRNFDDDSFNTYSQRTEIQHFIPHGERQWFNKIGWEAGQWLSYFVEKHGGRILRAPTEITWMKGHHGGQALQSTVFGGFTHIWAGTVSNLQNDIARDVRKQKLEQQNYWFSQLPDDLRNQITELERRNP